MSSLCSCREVEKVKMDNTSQCNTWYMEIHWLTTHGLWSKSLLFEKVKMDNTSQCNTWYMEMHWLTTHGLWSKSTIAFWLTKFCPLLITMTSSKCHDSKLTSYCNFCGKCDAIHLSLPYFSGNMLSQCCFRKYIVPSYLLGNYVLQSNTMRA